MKKLITLLFVCLILCTLTACDKEENNVSEKDVNVSVENVENTVGKVDKNVFIPDDNWVLYKLTTKMGYVRIHEYNDKGHLVKMTVTAPNGDVDEDIYTYTYNPDGSYSYEKDGYSGYKSAKYDAQGRIIEESLSNDKTRVYVYNDDNTVDCTDYTKDGYIYQIEKRFYNDKELLEKSEHYISNGKMLAYKLYYYDEYGNETTNNTFTPEGDKASNDAVYVWEMEFDEHGRLIKKVKGVPETGGFASEVIYNYDDENRIYTTSSVTAREDCEYRHYMDCQIAE